MKMNDYENNMNIKGEWSMIFHHYYSLLQVHITSSKQKGAIHYRLFALCCCFNYTNHRFDEAD